MVIDEKSLPNPRSPKFMPVLSSKSLIVLAVHEIYIIVIAKEL
jgi:hypothetical protein